MAESISTALIEYLKTKAPVTALVGTGTAARIYKSLPKQGTPIPYIVLETFEGGSAEHLGGISGMAKNRIQIDCYASTSVAAHDLAELVRYAPLQGEGHFTMSTLAVLDVSSASGYRDGNDPPAEGSRHARYWQSRDYQFSYREPTS